MQYAVPAILAFIVLRCAAALLFSSSKEEVWGTLVTKGGDAFEIGHWENALGRSLGADVRVKDKKAAPIAAALVREETGDWTISDLGGAMLRGKPLKKRSRINTGDTVKLGDTELTFTRSTKKMEENLEIEREAKVGAAGISCVAALTALCAVLAWELSSNLGAEYLPNILFAFGAVAALGWAGFIMTRFLGRRGYELETLGFALSAVGFAVCLSSDPDNIYKLGVCLAAGVCLYFGLGFFLRDHRRASAMRLPVAGLGLALLAVNIVAATELLGAKNWLSLGGVSVQPSELVKIAFIFAGSVSLERIMSRGNVALFVGFAALCVGALAYMRDFGTALVFFTVYLVIAFMRSGSFATVLLSAAGAALAAFLAISARPYIADRFAVWGRAWEDAANLGYQQTRTMAAVASGGLFGLGAGKGWFNTVFAADTDMVFGVVSEELGFIAACLCVIILLLMAFFAVRSVGNARSSFYAIAACAAVSFYLAQCSLNVFGSLDLLPFTGVTFPFLSKGGTSLIASWAMLAFLKAADTRPGASFAVRPLGERRIKKRPPRKEESDEEA